ncbi:hypothetical protein ACQEUU_17165 [Nonomuraea sp. CA-218870]
MTTVLTDSAVSEAVLFVSAGQPSLPRHPGLVRAANRLVTA